LKIAPKAKAIKVKINKWDFIKIQSCSVAKETVNTVKTIYEMDGIIFSPHM
jgi:hypothetical protein